MDSNMHLQTLMWLNKQIDDINAKGAFIGEMLIEENDTKIIKKLDKKLQELENELEIINQKIQFERSLINSWE
jgi:chaperonin cofactor prefoldin